MEESNKGVKVVGFWVSLFTHRVRWGLKMKGIEYEYVEEDINNKSPLLFELNPVYGKVPILVHGGVSLPESCIILEYIDQIWTHNPLLPLDPYQRSQARFWAKFADSKVLVPARFAYCLDGEDQERAVKIAIVNLEKIEEIIEGKKFFGGNTIGNSILRSASPSPTARRRRCTQLHRAPLPPPHPAPPPPTQFQKVSYKLTIVAPVDSPNTDGIHISASTHVELKDMVIGTGDGCISIVSNSSGIRIRNIYCGPGHGIRYLIKKPKEVSLDNESLP